MVNTVKSLVMPDGEEFEFIGKTYYGECSTNADSSTKLVNISEIDPNSLVNGIVIYVRFWYKNRTSSPSLKVNNGSAIPIRFRDERDDDNPTYGLPSYYWGDGDVISFIYVNNYWVILDSHQYYYGVCNTAASNAEKTVMIPGFDNSSFKYGTLVFINFKYGNTANHARAFIENTTISTYLYKSGTSHDGTNADIIAIGNFSPGIKAFIIEIERLSNGAVDTRLMSVMDPNVPTVSVVRNLTGGTKIGTITVNGTGTDLYAPTPPSKVSELSNDSGFITGISSTDVTTALGYTPYNSTNPNGYVNAAGASAAAPVQSVNSKTGTVTLSAADVGALPSNTVIPTVVSTYTSSGTDAVNGKAVYAALQTLDSSIAATTNQAISAITITDGKITASSKITIPTVPSNVSAFNNDAGYITNAGVTGVKGNAESSYRTGQVNLTAANIGAVALSGNETVAGNKTFSGTTTLNAASVYPASQNTILTANAGAIIQSPIPKYLWHDIIAFCRATTPTYYTTTNGSTWTEATLEKRLFAHMNSWGNQQVLNSSIQGSRWVWHNGAFAYSSLSWIVLGITYNANIATFDLVLETTADATADSPTWTTLCSITGAKYNQQPIWIKSNGPSSTGDLRLTITRTSGDTTTNILPLCAIEFLTTRWGDQGKGSEFEYPYNWDGTPNIYPIKNNVSSLGTASYKWANVYATTLTGNVTGTATGNLTSVQYDSTNAKLTYTKNGSNTDIVTIATLKSALDIPQVYSPTNTGGYLTMATLPIYDGTVQTGT